MALLHPAIFHFNRQMDPFRRRRAINTVQSSAYSCSGFSAISLNYIGIVVDVDVESKIENGEEEIGMGQHLWPYLSTTFQFLSRKGLKFIKQRLTAMQQATPDDQASDHSDKYDFFVKKCDNLTAPTQLDEYLLMSFTEMMTIAAWALTKRRFFETNNTPMAASTCSVQLGITPSQWWRALACILLWIFWSLVYIWLLVFVVQNV